MCTLACVILLVAAAAKFAAAGASAVVAVAAVDVPEAGIVAGVLAADAAAMASAAGLDTAVNDRGGYGSPEAVAMLEAAAATGIFPVRAGFGAAVAAVAAAATGMLPVSAGFDVVEGAAVTSGCGANDEDCSVVGLFDAAVSNRAVIVGVCSVLLLLSWLGCSGSDAGVFPASILEGFSFDAIFFRARYYPLLQKSTDKLRQDKC